MFSFYVYDEELPFYFVILECLYTQKSPQLTCNGEKNVQLILEVTRLVVHAIIWVGPNFF